MQLQDLQLRLLHICNMTNLLERRSTKYVVLGVNYL